MTYKQLVEKEKMITGIGYLESRGIKVIIGLPSEQDKLPHLIFRGPRDIIPGYELSKWVEDPIIYRINENSGVHKGTGYFPSSLPIQIWISNIRDTLIECRKFDGEDKEFSTQPGEPINVFVVDPEWKVIADALAESANR